MTKSFNAAPYNAADLVARIHDSPQRAVVAVTGGGSRVIADLLAVPGASRTVLEAIVPYSAPAEIAFLGAKPEQFCSRATARAMAMAAFQRAAWLRAAEQPAGDWPVIGLGMTASLASDRPKRGPHRIHLAAQTEQCTWSQSLELTKGLRSRDEEESIAAAVALDLLAEACEIAERPIVPLAAGEKLDRRRTVGLPSWRGLLTGDIRRTDERPGFAGATQSPRAVFPGSFNPLHEGHRRMAAIAEKLVGGPVAYEMSIENVEKPPLDFEEMQARATQFAADTQVWFTRAPRMVQKAKLFPGAVIVCGIDTLLRLADPRFADDNLSERDRVIAEIAATGCRFLVFGRATAAGFQTLESIELPSALRALCDGVSEQEFRADVSSTELRAGLPHE